MKPAHTRTTPVKPEPAVSGLPEEEPEPEPEPEPEEWEGVLVIEGVSTGDRRDTFEDWYGSLAEAGDAEELLAIDRQDSERRTRNSIRLQRSDQGRELRVGLYEGKISHEVAANLGAHLSTWDHDEPPIFVALDEGTLDIGIVDPARFTHTNDFRLFMETFPPTTAPRGGITYVIPSDFTSPEG